jgi:hypothetical protein
MRNQIFTFERHRTIGAMLAFGIPIRQGAFAQIRWTTAAQGKRLRGRGRRANPRFAASIAITIAFMHSWIGHAFAASSAETGSSGAFP